MTTTPPGWYPDPKMVGTQRYWNGEEWTDHAAPLANAPTRQAAVANANLESAGWATAILIPIVGVVIGIILAARGNPKGLQVILLSIVAISIYASLLAG